MKPKHKTSLQRTMVLYFLLIGVASALMGVEFIADTHSGKIRQELEQGIKGYASGELTMGQALEPIHLLREKAVLMLAVVLIFMVVVLSMFIQRITVPLQNMIQAASKMADGNLGATVQAPSHNELADLAGVINEMSTNLQEVVLLTLHLCRSGRNYQQAAASRSEKERALALEAFARELDTMEGLLEGFRFLATDKGRE